MDISKLVAPQPDSLLVTDERELRGQRVWRHVSAITATWAFFAGFYFLRGYIPASIVCSSELVVIAAISIYFRKTNDYCRLMHANLVACSLGVLLIATSDPALRLSVFFFPIAILIASLFGTAQATYWLLGPLVNFLIYYLTIYGLHATFD